MVAASIAGAALALAIAGLANWLKFDRDRALYPTLLIVIASYWVLFAVIGGSGATVLFEVIAAAIFSVLAIVGFRSATWLIAAGLAGHGVYDVVHDIFIHNQGAPLWWAAFCASADFVLAAAVAVSQRTRH